MHRDIDLPALFRMAGVEHKFADEGPTYVVIEHESVCFEFMRSGERVPVLDGKAMMLQGVTATDGLAHELCKLTADYDCGYRFRLVNGDDVWMTIVQRMDEMSLEDVKDYVDDLIEQADMLDTFLREEFGGDTALPDE